MNKTNDKFIAIYGRKSKFTGKGDSIQVQVNFCTNYLHSRPSIPTNMKIVEYLDEGFSGGNANRPSFQQLIKDCKSNKVAILICYRLDRISRNLADFSKLYEILKSHNVEFISVNEQFDTSTPVGEAMLKISMVFAELERQTIAERIRDNMLELSRTGRWLGGTTPLGFESEKLSKTKQLDGKTRSLFKLTSLPTEKVIYHQLVNKFLETNSLTKVETYSHQTELLTRNGIYFSTSAIKEILINPVYAAADKDTYEYFIQKGAIIDLDISVFDGTHALMVYNKTDQSQNNSSRKHPINEWVFAIGKHKPFISGKEWVKIQNMLEQNSSKGYGKSKNNIALLSGLLRCAHCGSYMRPKAYRTFDKDGNKRFGYLCQEKEKSRGDNCCVDNATGLELDAMISQEIKKLVADNSILKTKLKETEKHLQSNYNSTGIDADSIKKGIAEREKRIKNLIRDLSLNEESSASSYIRDEISELVTEKQKLEKSLEEVTSLLQDKSAILAEMESLINKLSSFASSFDMMNLEEKRTTLRRLIAKITWDGTYAHVYLIGSDEDDTSIDKIIENFREPLQGGCK